MENIKIKPQILGDDAPIDLYFNGMNEKGNSYFQTQLSKTRKMMQNDFYFNADDQKMYYWGGSGDWKEFKGKYNIITNPETL